MFLLNVGYRRNIISEVRRLDAILQLATSNYSHRLARISGTRTSYSLFDPQLYLAPLDPQGRNKVTAKLASYPWFGVSDVEQYNGSSRDEEKEWERRLKSRIESIWPGRPPEGDSIYDACKAAIEYQISINTTHIVIPAPIIAEREDEGESAGIWLDAGISAARDLDVSQPMLATVVISEAVLNETAFRSDGLLEAIVDHVTSRGYRGYDVDGVYIVITQPDATQHPFQISTNTIRAYLHLVSGFKDAGMDEIIVNFADISGILALGLGATWFATGPSISLRTISLAGFKDAGYGRALPYYYSHKTAGEYKSETDLDKVVEAGAFRTISDITQFSEHLVKNLQKGGSASAIPAWAESQNNLAFAQKHFVQRMVEEARSIAVLPSSTQKYEAVYDWLESTEAQALLLEKRIHLQHGNNFARRAPTLEWADILKKYN